MARVKGTRTVIIVDGNDITQYCTDSNVERSSGTEDNTTFGKDDVVKDGTLRDGVFAASGKYDSAVGGPASVLFPLIGEKVNVKYRSEGTGTGLPQYSFDAVITKYVETSPVAGYITWALETEPSDNWNTADQA